MTLKRYKQIELKNLLHNLYYVPIPIILVREHLWAKGI